MTQVPGWGGGGHDAFLVPDDEESQCGVADERAHVEPLAPRVERGEVLGNGLEAPLDARVE